MLGLCNEEMYRTIEVFRDTVCRCGGRLHEEKEEENEIEIRTKEMSEIEMRVKVE